MIYTMFDIYGINFKVFWDEVEKSHTDMPQVYYEVYVDFMEDVYDEKRSLKENVRMAYEYIVVHQNDYD